MVGLIPWETVLHELPQHRSFQQSACVHHLIQCGCCPWVAVPQEQTSPVQSLLCMCPARSLLQFILLMEPQPPSDIHLFQHGVLQGLKGDHQLHHSPPWAAGAQLPHLALYHQLQKDLCSSTWCTPLASSSLTWEDAYVFISYSHASLCCCYSE